MCVGAEGSNAELLLSRLPAGAHRWYQPPPSRNLQALQTQQQRKEDDEEAETKCAHAA